MGLRRGLFAIAVLTVAVAEGTGRSADLSVEVAGIEDTRGRISIGVFGSAEGFPKPGSEVTGARVAPSVPSVLHRFQGLSAGRYAVAVFHDRDGDGELDTGLVGFPTEPYGFSAGAQASMLGPPGFDAAAFDLRTDTRVRIELVQP